MDFSLCLCPQPIKEPGFLFLRIVFLPVQCSFRLIAPPKWVAAVTVWLCHSAVVCFQKYNKKATRSKSRRKCFSAFPGAQHHNLGKVWARHWVITARHYCRFRRAKQTVQTAAAYHIDGVRCSVTLQWKKTAKQWAVSDEMLPQST